MCLVEHTVEEMEENALLGCIPPGIEPSLMPDLLGADLGSKSRLFACTSADHTAIRWVVPAQQAGWFSALILDRVELSGAVRYLTTHADVVIVGSEDAARAVEKSTGVRPSVIPQASARDVIDAARTAGPSLPRVVLGLD